MHYRKNELSRSTSIVDLNNNHFKLDYSELIEKTLLGEGQFGVVYEMFHEPSGLTFAVKVKMAIITDIFLTS